LGQFSIKYTCPGCGAKLTSPIRDAGKTDSCPDCRRVFVLPVEAGTQAAAIQQERQAMKEAKKELRAAARVKYERPPPIPVATVAEDENPYSPPPIPSIRTGMMYCSTCGSQIHEKAVICPKCGVPTQNYNPSRGNDGGEVSIGLVVTGYVMALLLPLVGIIRDITKSCG
jgi:uncharacterized paraquat-inducible protein A